MKSYQQIFLQSRQYALDSAQILWLYKLAAKFRFIFMQIFWTLIAWTKINSIGKCVEEGFLMNQLLSLRILMSSEFQILWLPLSSLLASVAFLTF